MTAKVTQWSIYFNINFISFVKEGTGLFQLLRSGQGNLIRQVLPSIKHVTGFHTCDVSSGVFRESNNDMSKAMGLKMKSVKWEKYNKIVYPPLAEEDGVRPAEITHSRHNVKYSPLKMWYIAVMIRGMTIDEALKQLTFYKRKGSEVIKEILEEAQEMAVRDHNVEFKSNLWITDSFVGRGKIMKGMRRHAKGRYGIIQYRYCHYFVRLREGPPPKHYYPPPETGHQKMEDYITRQRSRRIIHSL